MAGPGPGGTGGAQGTWPIKLPIYQAPPQSRCHAVPGDFPDDYPPARELALSLVARYHEETNPETYHQASSDLVRQPYLNAFQYRFALLQAEHACRLAPDRQEYRTGLGAARLRRPIP